MPIIPALRKQADLYEFKAHLNYMDSTSLGTPSRQKMTEEFQRVAVTRL